MRGFFFWMPLFGYTHLRAADEDCPLVETNNENAFISALNQVSN